jgi:hypothetical protein
MDTALPDPGANPARNLETGLRHFCSFISENAPKSWLRVRCIIRIVALILVIFTWLLYSERIDLQRTSADAPEVKVVTSEEMKKLYEENTRIRSDIDGLRRSLDAISSKLDSRQPTQEQRRH